MFFKVAICALWFAATGAAFFRFQDYQATGGTAGIAPSQWPTKSRIELETNRSTLLLFAHPACPCTRASIEELNRLLARSQGRIATHVLLFAPDPAPANWKKSTMAASVAAIPGVTVHDDVNGSEARQFGAQTSGHVLVYNRSGKLVFSGGITAARGHVGDNPGSEAVLASLDGPLSGVRTAVFGCSLEERAGMDQQGERQ